jgi:hypothetical protein
VREEEKKATRVVLHWVCHPKRKISMRRFHHHHGSWCLDVGRCHPNTVGHFLFLNCILYLLKYQITHSANLIITKKPLWKIHKSLWMLVYKFLLSSMINLIITKRSCEKTQLPQITSSLHFFNEQYLLIFRFC